MTDLVLSVHAGARVRAKYAGARPFASVTIEQDGVCFDSDGIEKGTSKSFGAPAGAVRVICRLGGNGKQVVRELSLKPGETQELVFEDQD